MSRNDAGYLLKTDCHHVSDSMPRALTIPDKVRGVYKTRRTKHPVCIFPCFTDKLYSLSSHGSHLLCLDAVMMCVCFARCPAATVDK